MNLSDCGARFISQWEGYSSTAYWDADGRVWTIGFGTTGPHAYQGATCTREQALQWLHDEADGKDAAAINALGKPFNQAQFDALTSFCFNLGPHILDHGHDIRAALDGDWSTVPAAMAEYDKAGGHSMAGLTRRRRAEGVLFATGNYGFECFPTVPPPRRLVLTGDD